VLAHIYPVDFDYPSPAYVDAEWNRYLQEQAAALLDEARERFCRRHNWSKVAVAMAGHKSSGIGLANLAHERDAAMVVIGSAPGAARGRFAIGSTANQLLHEASVPVAVAPSGYAREEVTHVGRLVLAFSDSQDAVGHVSVAADFAVRMGAPLELLSIVLRHRMYGSKLGSQAEEPVIEQMREQMLRQQQAAFAAVTDELPHSAETVVGESVSSAMASVSWKGNELLLMGSATRGPLLRVFLGDMTHKLLRSTPVPAIVLPRGG
jgi:nucleotide-binding universal stress UspA family protein